MKFRAMLLPLAVFIAAAWLLISQSRAISSVREKTSLLREQVSASASDDSSPSLPDKSNTTRSRTSANSSINWLSIAEITGEQGANGIFAKQELLRAKKRILLMTPEELLAALAGIKTLGLDVRSRGKIDGMLITSLGEKDPEAAATYLTTPGNDHIGLSGRLLNNILTAWTKTDLPAALAWFDGQIADGTFDSKSLDGKNYRRFNIEAVFLANLAISDPAAATRRLSAYPETHRAYIFEQISQYDGSAGRALDENELASRVILARDNLPGPEQASAIAKSISRFSQAGDYEKIDRFLERVAATPDELTASIAATARDRFSSLYSEGKLTTGEIDNFREWATRQSPTTVDDATGKALAVLASNRHNGSDPTAQINELLLHYQEASGNDDVLLGFLESWIFWGDATQARSLAEKIRNPDRRNEFLKKLEPEPPAP